MTSYMKCLTLGSDVYAIQTDEGCQNVAAVVPSDALNDFH